MQIGISDQSGFEPIQIWLNSEPKSIPSDTAQWFSQFDLWPSLIITSKSTLSRLTNWKIVSKLDWLETWTWNSKDLRLRWWEFEWYKIWSVKNTKSDLNYSLFFLSKRSLETKPIWRSKSSISPQILTDRFQDFRIIECALRGLKFYQISWPCGNILWLH